MTNQNSGPTTASLIYEYFPWGTEYPGRDELNAVQREQYVKEWLKERVTPHSHTALALIALIQGIIKELEAGISDCERPRFLARIDTSHIVKTPEGILDKMIRSWGSRTPGRPGICFNNFETEMKDLARFRITANFLSDVKLIAETLESPYGSGDLISLSKSQKVLRQQFQLEGNGFENSITVLPGKRSKGERCMKGVFYPKNGVYSICHVEVQVVTILQEAWDKKDHFLIYEQRRSENPVNIDHEIESFSMSEMLYVADLTFDRLKEAVFNSEKRGGSNNAASK